MNNEEILKHLDLQTDIPTCDNSVVALTHSGTILESTVYDDGMIVQVIDLVEPINDEEETITSKELESYCDYRIEQITEELNGILERCDGNFRYKITKASPHEIKTS